ncbi:MAG: 50S ribosomal protein L9 [Parcubacteria group bacterium GW2011_GWF2_39_8b]|uniref:Large ribosomal subunit protein bL9 n=3 Tax=Candidatus Zambryskiibacteriota TaxID=1817925 RepID=A0A1G2T619_9BACT|nr:MAG: 50S ribosomal protein L9 [Parcubacteria group bacterium GW2011_GWF2_39_8b]KKR46040.1 MAG: 50S ribosomal protein L9 [Parcubacteria group bacterium GW2011_GWA2_40_14]OHA92720.1 MAG: 50S ribosomal protein L9 [Candidatus Zambryskibacteria bacterium RIFCSPHIGHO2_02_38_10.5]OHA98915.1 MAG: 50S ribosomal protein L9 [Candidatus Zambryskibacteria bacterium RIFCSPHIGHO2_12_FULL_38_37]OHB08502.1 MAG: 50S ribosomal protein L9 [Candidatus Zambryskibacteria bacterium RIFCSPLOWO2_02_39_10]OHB10796.1 
MQIILLRDVPKIGRKYDVKDVSDGYALNWLFPRALATVATASGIQKIEQMKKNDLVERQIQGELLSKNLETIKNITLNLKEKANDKGHLFAGVTKEMLALEILKIARLNIDPESIQLPKPIKEVGEYQITIEALGKKAEFTVLIESQ